jgi:hypothetical protein
MKPSLDLKVARTLRDHLAIGGFDDLTPDEIADVGFWVHTVFMANNEDEKDLEIPWNQ